MRTKSSKDVVPLTNLEINPGRGAAVVRSVSDYETADEERTFMRAMIHANPATYDAGSAATPLPADPGHTRAGRPAFPPLRAYPLPAAGCSVTPHPAAALELREEDEGYVPDIPSGRHAGADPALGRAAAADTAASREAMALIDEAANLVSVLIAAIEEDGDARASQAETVLCIVRKKLDKAHRRVDRQESRHRDLFLAYGEVKERLKRDEE